jgi:hypothetical protein
VCEAGFVSGWTVAGLVGRAAVDRVDRDRDRDRDRVGV